MLGIARGWFEDRVVDRDIFEARVFALQNGRVFRGPDAFGDAHHGGVRFGQVTPKSFDECGEPPEEHAGIPEIAAGSDVFAGQRQRRLLRKAANGIGAFLGKCGGLPAVARSSFDVAVAGFRARRRDSQDDEGIGLSGDSQGGANDLAIAGGLGDEVVGGQDSHKRIATGLFPQQMRSGKSNGRCGIAADGLDQGVLRGNLPQLAAHRIGLLVVGYGPNAGSGKERGKALKGLLEHRFLPDDVQQLLGRTGAAARPETGAASAREDDGVRRRRRRLHWRRTAERCDSLAPFSASSRESCCRSGT